MTKYVVPALLILLAASAAFSAQAPLGVRENFQVLSINPGFGNRYRQGCFFPVAVEMTVAVEPVSGTITVTPESGDADVPVYVVPFDLNPGTRYRYFVYPFCDGEGERYTLKIADSRGRALRTEELSMTGRSSMYYYVAVLGGQGVIGITKREPTAESCGMETAFVNLDYLPSRAWGYDTADALLWPHPDPADLTVSQVSALREWVLGGGRIVLCVGDSWQAAASAPLLKELLPGAITGMENTTDLGELASIGNLSFEKDRKMAIAVMEKVRGEVLMKAGSRPLVVRGRAGFGEVIFVAFDPTKSPFAQWDGAGRFWNSVFGTGALAADPKRSAVSQNYYPGRVGQGSDSGYETNILTKLNMFSKIQPISFSFVVSFLLAYVILVGPVDYFVLKKLKHLEWTWFTFPAIALGATVVAFIVISSGRVARVYINQLAVADWSADGKASRFYTASAVISPSNDYYDVSYLSPNANLWLAQSSRRGGGMGAFTSIRYNVADRPEEGMSFSGVFMPVWSPKTFCARWCASEGDPPPLTARLKAVGSNLLGSVTNESDGDLGNVTIVHSTGILNLGAIGAGGTVQVDGKRTTSYDKFVGDTGGQTGWPGYKGERGGDTQVEFWTFLNPLVLRASFSKDFRFFPLAHFQRYQASIEGAGQGMYYDLPSELSMRSLTDAGFAVLLATSPDCPYPIATKAGSPEKLQSTVYRVCVAVPRS